LVTDVGLHTGKITREESIQYMMEKQTSVSETERYGPGRSINRRIENNGIKAKYIKEWAPSLKSKNFMTPFTSWVRAVKRV
jgi:hypothetical protein